MPLFLPILMTALLATALFLWACRNRPVRFSAQPIELYNIFSGATAGYPQPPLRPVPPSGSLPPGGAPREPADPRAEPSTPAPRNPLASGEPGPGGTIETDELREIQDAFSSVSGLSLALYGSEGSTLSPPSLENPICARVQQSPQGARHCRAHCGRGVATALLTGDPVFFKCEAGLHVFTLPVVTGSNEPGTNLAVQGGKAYHDAAEFDEAVGRAGALGLTPNELESFRDGIRVKDQKFMAASARLLESFFPLLVSALNERRAMRNQSTRMMSLFNLFSQLVDDRSFSQQATTVLNTLGILYGLRSASVMALDAKDKRYKTEAVFGLEKDSVGQYTTESITGLLGDLRDTGGPVSSDDTLKILRMGLPAEVSSVHLFPIRAKGGLVASLLAVFDTPLSKDEVGVISAFCDQVGLFQEIKELRSERRELTKDMSVLLEIARTVGSALDSEDLFGIILEKSAGFLDAEQGSLLLIDEDRMELRVKAMKGLNKKIVELLRIRPGEGIAGRVFSTGSPLLVHDIESDDRIAQERRPRYRTKSFISAPLRLNGRIFGVINIADKASGGVFSEEDLHILVSIGTYASVAIERSQFYHKTQELKKISITDSLTSLLNRRYFQERISEEIERSRRHHLPLSLIMIDVDNFKMINDTYGHTVGDEVLKIVSRCLRNCIRTIDVAARYGGEEFTVILPQTGKDAATVIAQRICHEIAKMDFPFGLMEQRAPLTVSLGLATYPDDADGIETLIRNSDVALYSAKTQGKNRVVVYRKPAES